MRVRPYYNGYMTGGAASYVVMKVVPAIIYHCNAVSVLDLLIFVESARV